MNHPWGVLVAALWGLVAGGLFVYVVQQRVEAALRMMLDRREDELAQERKRSEALVERIVSLRQAGYELSRAGQVRHPDKPEDKAMERAEQLQRVRIEDDKFIRNAMAKIRRDHPDVSEAAALREARRLLDAARMEQPPE
jgi:hypothetical protein